jgi:hypothetical protein
MRRITPELARAVREDADETYDTNKALAKRFGLTRDYIDRILDDPSYPYPDDCKSLSKGSRLPSRIPAPETVSTWFTDVMKHMIPLNVSKENEGIIQEAIDDFVSILRNILSATAADVVESRVNPHIALSKRLKSKSASPP